MGIRLVIPHADTEAVHGHASTKLCTLLLAAMAKADSIGSAEEQQGNHDTDCSNSNSESRVENSLGLGIVCF